MLQLSRLRVPDLDGISFASCRQAPAVRAERHRLPKPSTWTSSVSCGLLFLVQVRWIPGPHLDRPVVARRGQVLAVGAERHAPDLHGRAGRRRRLPCRSWRRAPARCVPDLRGRGSGRGVEGHEEGQVAPLANLIDVLSTGRRLPDLDDRFSARGLQRPRRCACRRGCTPRERRSRRSAEVQARHEVASLRRPRPSRSDSQAGDAGSASGRQVPPSGLNATLQTSSSCSAGQVSWPSSSRTGVASQMRMVPSLLAEARRRPSGLNATQWQKSGVSAQVEYLPAGRRVPDFAPSCLRRPRRGAGRRG